MKSEARDGMSIDWDAPIAMDDGVVLRADVFRPPGMRRHPVILSYGPVRQGPRLSGWVQRQLGAPDQRGARGPHGSSNKYQVWELVDPEKWVPDGYACVRVDFRGRRAFAGYHRYLVAARSAGSLPVH